MTPDLAAVVAKVLAAHERTWAGSRFYWTCSCRTWEGGTTADHRAHVAAEVTNALTTALTRPDVVEAAAMAVVERYEAWDAVPKSVRREARAEVAVAFKAALAAIPEALGAGETRDVLHPTTAEEATNE